MSGHRKLRRLPCKLQPLPRPKRGSWQHDRSAAARGYGWAWTQLRARILQRDCGLCQPCMRAGRVTLATEVDHVVPRSDGGTDGEANLQSICAECHAAKSAIERARSARWRP